MVVFNVMGHGESSAREARAKILVYISLSLSLYIYIYTQTQLFRISILERFWRDSGEVLERDLRDEK